MKLVARIAAFTSAAVILGLSQTAVAAQEQVSVVMEAQVDKGVSGSATVSAAGGGETEVTILLSGMEPDSSHVNHIHEASGCEEGEVEGIVEQLTNIDADATGEGSATTSVGLDFATVTDGNHVLVVRDGATLEEGSFAISCGVIPAADVESPTEVATDVPTEEPPGMNPPTAGTGPFDDGSAPSATVIAAVLLAGVVLLGIGWTSRERGHR